GGLAAQTDPLRTRREAVQRRRRALAGAGRIRELDFGPLARSDEVCDLRVEDAPLVGTGGTAAVGSRVPLRQAREVERRDRGVEPCDLARELLRPLGGRRLQRERPQPLPHLLL